MGSKGSRTFSCAMVLIPRFPARLIVVAFLPNGRNRENPEIRGTNHVWGLPRLRAWGISFEVGEKIALSQAILQLGRCWSIREGSKKLENRLLVPTNKFHSFISGRCGHTNPILWTQVSPCCCNTSSRT